MIDESFPTMGEAQPAHLGSQSESPVKTASNMDDLPKVPNPSNSLSIVPTQDAAKRTSQEWWSTQGLAKRLGGSKK